MVGKIDDEFLELPDEVLITAMREHQKYFAVTNEGEAKLQIGPRVLKKKDGTDRVPSKAGRLSIEDVIWIYDIIDEVKDELSDLVGPE